MMTRHAIATALAAAVLVGMAAPAAQRRRPDNSIHGAPVATNRILQDPSAFYGKLVTVSAGVVQVLSRTAFVVDQRKMAGPKQVTAAGTPILVIVPQLGAEVRPGRYFLIRGHVTPFDADAIAAAAPGYALDIAAGAAFAFRGQPVVVATSVIDATYAELVAQPARPAETPVATAAP